MKNRIIRVAAMLLVLVMMTLALTSCASSKIYKLTDGQHGTYSIREDEYLYFLGYYKAQLVDSLSNSTDFVDSPSYWNRPLDAASSQLLGGSVATYAEMYELMYRSSIEQMVTTQLFCQLLFDQYELEDTALWNKYQGNVDTMLFTFLTYYGLSVAELNAQGKSCGISYKLLERIYTMQAKTACVQEYLYGENYEKIDPVIADELYHGSDAMKAEGYLGYIAYRPIAIHTERTIKEVVNETTGKVTYELIPLSAEEKEYKELLAKEIRTLLGMKGGFEGEYTYTILRGDETFDELYETYSEDKTYDTVYAMTTTAPSNYGLINALTLTPVGDYAESALSYTMTTANGSVDRSVGIEIAKRVELEDKAYEKEENALFFGSFKSTVATIQFYRLLKDKMSVYASATKYNTNRMARFTICGADANTVDYPIMTGKYN